MSTQEIDNLIQGYLKTKGILSSMTLKGKGWEPKSIDAEQLLAPQVFVYVVDFPTRWTWLASVPFDSFNTVAAQCRYSRMSGPRCETGWAP